MAHRDGTYEAVIGLEVHAQLLTASKAFCGCSTAFGNAPNTNTCPVCLGLPGVLPVLNQQVVEFAIRLGLATNSRIASRSIFARKHYFYPDLPKGYQISQYDEPICTGGMVEIDLDDGTRKQIGLTRIHMEEDAGKSIHDRGSTTLVDVNRCGVPLLEIVSEPDIRSAREAYLYLYRIRQIVTYLGICDGNMEEGSLRCDANVSIRKTGETTFGTKTEVKNLNSFRFVEKALDYEITRQKEILGNGGVVRQQTLLWDSAKGEAVPMRSKEEAQDYRYFPEPDLGPILVSADTIETIRSGLAEHPMARRDRFMRMFDLPRYDADLLTSEKSYADYFEAVVANLGEHSRELPKQVGNWVMTDVLRVIAEQKTSIADFQIQPERLASMILLINDGTISGKTAKEIFQEMLTSSESPQAIVQRKGLGQISDEGVLRSVIEEVLAKNQPQVERFRNGEEKVFGFFVGQVMKLTGGKANPGLVNTILRRLLAG